MLFYSRPGSPSHPASNGRSASCSIWCENGRIRIVPPSSAASSSYPVLSRSPQIHSSLLSGCLGFASYNLYICSLLMNLYLCISLDYTEQNRKNISLSIENSCNHIISHLISFHFSTTSILLFLLSYNYCCCYCYCSCPAATATATVCLVLCYIIQHKYNSCSARSTHSLLIPFRPFFNTYELGILKL